ncbi:MAG: GNAT family N-acetyltransferase [Candidatus Eisenbacteria bacterium]|nr:GNAT family N-acetyltransferase [Candidatus Eisenbacteria bacterium]
MKIFVRPMSQLAPSVVELLVGNCFFSTPGFAEIWRTKGGRSVAWVAENDGEISAILPGVEFGHGRLCRFMSMPDGCYGGVFFAKGLTREREPIAQRLIDEIVRRRYSKTYLFDFYGSVPLHPRFETVLCATTLVDISDPEWVPPDRKLLSQIRKADREGIRVEPFDWDQHNNRFMKLVRSTDRRHGRALKYPASFFEALARLARRDSRIHWMWCEYDGKPASSQIYVVENGALQAWQTYFDREFSFLKPNQYMRFMLCRKVAKLGIKRLNLGATPGGAVGLARYKSRWGGEPFLYNCYVLRTGLGRIL